MKIKDKQRYSQLLGRKLFTSNTAYQSVDVDVDVASGREDEEVVEESHQLHVFPPLHFNLSSEIDHPTGSVKMDKMPPSTPDSFGDLIDGRNYDFREDSSPTAIDSNNKNNPFTKTAAPIVVGGSSQKGKVIETIGSPPRVSAKQTKKKNCSLLCQWPENMKDDDLVEEVWQGDDAELNGDNHLSTQSAPSAEFVVSGSIELKTADQPSGITFQKVDDICPLKIQGFSPFSPFKTKTYLKPGMVVLEINGRDMTWESTKEAIAEIKKAKPGKVTIKAIAPRKIKSEKLSLPPPRKDEKKKESPSVTTGKNAAFLEPISMNHRDPSLMMVESIATAETTESAIKDATTSSDGPSFRELNPSLMTVDSTVTTETTDMPTFNVGTGPELQVSRTTATDEKVKNHTQDAQDTKFKTVSPKRIPISLLGDLEEENPLDDDYPDEEDDILPTPKFSVPSSTRNKTGIDPEPSRHDDRNDDDDIHSKPKILTPLSTEPSRRGDVSKKQTDSWAKSSLPPVDQPKKKRKEKTATSSSHTAKHESMGTDWQYGVDPCTFCNSLPVGIEVKPMLATVQGFSKLTTSISENIPSWARVIFFQE